VAENTTGCNSYEYVTAVYRAFMPHFYSASAFRMRSTSHADCCRIRCSAQSGCHCRWCSL